jgi:DNA-directed RNA polymerase specialized sigma24 family protein
MADPQQHAWPSFSESYTDEFGQVDREVYEAAGLSWPKAVPLADSALKDVARGLELMLKAAAIVTRVRRESPDRIDNLRAYVFVTFKHLVLAELEKENGHRVKDREYHDSIPAGEPSRVDVERKILIQQLESRMDDWGRKVFHLLTLGHTYEEIGPVVGMSGHAVGKRFREQVNRIRTEIEAETLPTPPEADESAISRDTGTSRPPRKNI